MILRFKNWDKYNKRQKDIKRPYWFAMSNEIFTDAFYVDLSDQERQAFLWLLCEASKQNKYGEVEVSEKLFTQITGYKIRILNETIAKLLKSGRAAGSRQDGGRMATATEQNRTEQDIYSSNNDEACEASEISFSPNDLVQLWNDKADPSLARVLRLTDKRRKLAQTAIRDYPDPEFWSDLISAVNSSNFLLGRGAVTGDRSKAWRCDFDFIIRSDNALKIIEGKYS